MPGLFLSRTGKAMERVGLWMLVEKYGRRSGILKHISPHTLRHCFATHLLEQKVDIRVIQVLLGHKKLETTSMYAQVATEVLREVISPIETLPPG